MFARPLLALLTSLTLAAPLQDASFRVEPDQQNVVATRLEGAWEPDPDLNERLGRKGGQRFEFESDASVAGRIPEMYQEFLDEKQIFQAGLVTIRSAAERVEKYPYILITHSGNPHVVCFRERDGDAFGDAESFNLSIAGAKERENDLLFIGGDFNNQPFTAYRRVEK